MALNHLSAERDDLSQYFIVVLRRLFSVAFRTNDERTNDERTNDEGGQTSPGDTGNQRMVKPLDVQSVPSSIFGNEDLALLDSEALRSASGLNFSEWVDS